MKTRIISAGVVLAVFIPLLLLGGNLFNIAIILISGLYALYITLKVRPLDEKTAK